MLLLKNIMRKKTKIMFYIELDEEAYKDEEEQKNLIAKLKELIPGFNSITWDFHHVSYPKYYPEVAKIEDEKLDFEKHGHLLENYGRLEIYKDGKLSSVIGSFCDTICSCVELPRLMGNFEEKPSIDDISIKRKPCKSCGKTHEPLESLSLECYEAVEPLTKEEIQEAFKKGRNDLSWRRYPR